jgi:hypothetical protein
VLFHLNLSETALQLVALVWVGNTNISKELIGAYGLHRSYSALFEGHLGVVYGDIYNLD